jgi:hypothetical protein
MRSAKVAGTLAVICCISASGVVSAKGGGGHGGGHSGGGHSGGGHSGGGHSGGGHSGGGHSGGGHSGGSHSGGGHSGGGQSGGHASSGHGSGEHAATRPASGGHTVGTAVPRPANYPLPYRSPHWIYPPVLIAPSIGFLGAGAYASGFWPRYGYSRYGYPWYGYSGYGYSDDTYPMSAPGATTLSDTALPPEVQSSTENGSLRLDVRPVSAQLFVDGYFVGSVEDFLNTLAGVQLSAGPHRLELRAGGYETLEVDVMIQPGRAITFRADLKLQQ